MSQEFSDFMFMLLMIVIGATAVLGIFLLTTE